MTNYENIKALDMLRMAHFIHEVKDGLVDYDYCLNHCGYRNECDIDLEEPKCSDWECLYMDWLQSESTINFEEMYYGEKYIKVHKNE